MPGPIDTAYVDIIGRFRLESKENVDAAVRSLVSRIEGQLEALEARGTDKAKSLIKAFKRVNLDISVSDALSKLGKLEDKSQEVTSAIRRLNKNKIEGFQTQAAINSVENLERQLEKLRKTFTKTDEGKLRIDVTQAKAAIKLIDGAVRSLTRRIDDANAKGLDPGVTASTRAQVIQLEDLIGEISADIGRVNAKTITVDVDSLELDRLERRLALLDKNIAIELNTRVPGPANPEGTVNRLGSQVSAFQSAFGSAFRRLLAFGALRGAVHGVNQLFRAGIQAAGAIQTVEVTLNRFFAQTRDLGQTSGEFFNNLRKLALETPFEFEGLADTSRRILAMGVDADETIGIMGDLVDAVSAVGGGQGEIDGVVRALSQLRSKGRVDLQDFRQISENLPSLSRQLQIKGVIDELNDLHPELNATVADFTTLRNSGLITGKVLTDGVIRAIKEIPGVAGAARAASRTLEGALSNLADFAKQEFASAFGGLGGIIADELNDAFGNLTIGGELTPLSAAIRQVIEAFAGAGESALPSILQAVVDIAPGLSVLVDSLGELTREFLPGLTQVAGGAVNALTGLANVATAISTAFGLLPDGLQQVIGSFGTLALIIPGVSEALTAPIAIMANTTRGAQLMADGLAASATATAQTVRNAALAKAGLVALAVLGVQVITSSLAKAQQRSTEFNESVRDGARSLKEFETSGEAAIDFINKFRTAGEGVNLGSLENLVDGLSTPEIEQAIGATTNQIGILVDQLARADEEVNAINRSVTGAEVEVHKGADALQTALDEAGISMEQYTNAGSDAVASTQALVEQWKQAAEVQFDYAISSGKFALANSDVVDGIIAATEASGNYLQGIDDLKDAQNAGAKVALADAKARGATEEQIQAAIKANTTYKENIDGTSEAIINFAGAFQDVNELLQQQEGIFEGLTGSLSGFKTKFDALVNAAGTANLGTTFIDFAQGVTAAGFEVEQLNAIANELGQTLGIALSGEDLGKVIAHFTEMIQGFQSELEGVIPGLDDLQFEADSFSLDGFIEELNKIATARVEVGSNIEELVGRFGTIGSRALDALISSGLSKEHFAIAISQLLEGTDAEIEAKALELAASWNDAIAPIPEELANMLAGRRVSVEELNAALGLDAFGEVVTNVEGMAARLLESIASVPKQLPADFIGPTLPGQTRDVLTEAVPGIDVEAATTAAADAGTSVGEAYTKNIETAVSGATKDLEGSFEETVDSFEGFSGDISSSLEGAGDAAVEAFSVSFRKLTPEINDEIRRVLNRVGFFQLQLFFKAYAAGTGANRGFDTGLDLARVITREATKAATALANINLSGSARSAGYRLGRALGSGMAAGIAATMPAVRSSADNLVVGAESAARSTAIAASPSKLFAELGKDMGMGVVKGIDDSAGNIAKAVAVAIGDASQSGGTETQALASNVVSVLNSLVDRVNSAFKLIAGKLGVSQIFAGDPVKRFASGVVATSPTFGVFGEAGAEALIPLTNGRAAANIIAQLAPYIPSPGREAAATLLGGGNPGTGGSIVNHWENTFKLDGAVADPETLSAQIAVRLERRMTR